MPAIPTILKGDDTGDIVLTLDTTHTYTGATLVIAYQGVTKKFTDLAAGGTVRLRFGHAETEGFKLGCLPFLAQLVGPTGSVETLSNAEWRIKTTDIVAEVNAGGSFIVTPGGADVPVTDVGDLPSRFTDEQLAAKINQIVHVLAQRSLLCLFALLATWTGFGGGVTKKVKGEVYNDEPIVTDVDLSGVGLATNEVVDIVRNELSTNGIRSVDGVARPLPKYLHALDSDDTYPDDAAWYYAQADYSGGCSARRSGGLLERNYDWEFDDAAEFIIRVSATEGRYASIGVANVGTNLTENYVTSGKWSRYYKCLPGHMLDGINEAGVAVAINVTGGTPQWNTNSLPTAIHPLAAVRFVLDNAPTAGIGAATIAGRIRFPEGWTQNFHYIVADSNATFIVENGRYHKVTTAPVVMTNYNLFSPDKDVGEGKERYQLLNGGASITNAWFTRAYLRSTDWSSDFRDATEMEAAKQAWETHEREELRGHGLWQSVHTSVYDIINRTLRIAVQERDDWYIFSVPQGGKVKSVNGQTGDVVLAGEDVISDLATIRTGAAAGATAVQPAAISDMETRTHAAATFATKTALATLSDTVDSKLDKSGGTMTGNLNIPGGYIFMDDSGESYEGTYLYRDHLQVSMYGDKARLFPTQLESNGEVFEFPEVSGTLALTSDIPDVDDKIEAHDESETAHTDIRQAVSAKYSKPSSGIPKTDLASAVQTSLGKADSALQAAHNTSTTAHADIRTAAADAQAHSEATRQIVYTWEDFLDGSNVVISITNYISGAYSLDHAKLQIKELLPDSNEYRIVYDSRTEITNHTAAAKREIVGYVDGVATELRGEIADKGDKAWGRRSSTGQDVPISNTVWVTEQNLRIAGGMEYERVAVGEGAIYVLTSKGQTPYMVGDEGALMLKDDGGTNYFGMVRSDSYTIGCNTDGIRVENDLVYLDFSVTMSDHPCVWYTESLGGDVEWEQLNLPDGSAVPGASHVVVWDESPRLGAQECYINCENKPGGFFRATIEVAGDARFRTNMPAEIPSFYCADDPTKKVKIIWNNGNPKFVEAN